MEVGILREPAFENRVAMMPATVSQLAGLKVRVLVEKDAGKRAFASDQDYIDAGAEISTRSRILTGSDIILMINPLEDNDIRKIRDGKIVIGAFNPLFNHDLVNKYALANLTSFSLDVIPRTTRAQSMDIISSQASVSGYKAVLDAASRFGGFMNMFMSAAGTIKPARVLIIGAGVAGLQAIATSRKLGAVVESFDVRTAAKDEVQSLGAKFIEVEGATDDRSAGGYAVEQTGEYKERQRKVVHEHALKSDIIICTAQIPGKKAPLIIYKDTVEQMSPGSVIIDLAASTGGNCEITKENTVLFHRDVCIVGKSDYPSEMPADASLMFGKNMLNFVTLMINGDGSLNLNMNDDIIKGTCVTHNSEIIHTRVLDTIQNKL